MGSDRRRHPAGAAAYEIAELRYREGLSTQLELSDARLLLQQAQANRAQAARDVQVARVRLALLPDLPLTDYRREYADRTGGGSGRARRARRRADETQQGQTEHAGHHRDSRHDWNDGDDGSTATMRCLQRQ